MRSRGRLAALLELGAGFHPELTGRENVYLNASFLGLSRKDTDRVYRDIVDFAEIRDAMADFQRIYVEKTVEIPLYYRKNVELVGDKLGNFFANPTQAGPTWNAADWYVAG